VGQLFTELDERNRAFISAQHVFFVATAASAVDGHVNLSPKGLDTFRVLDPHAVAYLDLTGSGVETIAHLRENGRIVIMFCAFSGPPRILRLHGRGEVIENDAPGYAGLAALFPAYLSPRSVICVHLERISDSCGFGVPRYTFEDERSQLPDWSAHMGEQGLIDYRQEVNVRSIDGLPGLASVQSNVQ
jgi:hypothetical protein